MHPQLFLRTFWRMELRPQIFVAMSFDERYRSRFDDVIAPAIASIPFENAFLRPYRVDLSKTGDSILADIIDGIAHSQMVLADVSTVGKDSVTREPYRNGNVMYELGLALACRQTTEVLVLRDDKDKFLFDVSTIPHMTVDFTDTVRARSQVRNELIERMRTRQYFNDARVSIAVASLSNEEITQLKYIAGLPPGTVWGKAKSNTIDFLSMAAIPRLLDKGLIVVAGEFQDGGPAYKPTTLGLAVALHVKAGLQQFKAAKKDEPKEPGKEDGQKTENA